MASPAKSPRTSPAKPASPPKKKSPKKDEPTKSDAAQLKKLLGNDPLPAFLDRPQRERRAPAQMDLDIRFVKPLVVEEGRGKALGDIPNVAARISSLQTDDKALVLAHRICFGKPGKGTQRKKFLRKFNGTLDSEENVALKLDKMNLQPLRELGKLFDCVEPGKNDKDTLVDAIAKWMVKPKASGRVLQSAKKSSGSKKRGRPSSKGKKGKKSGGPKRPLSAYFIFCGARRPSIRKKHPDWSMTDVAQRLAKEWRALDDEDKKPFLKANKKAKEEYQQKLKEWEKKQKSKGGDSDSDDDDDDDDDEDDDDDDDDADESEEEAPAKKKRKVEKKESSDEEGGDDADDDDKKEEKDKKKDKKEESEEEKEEGGDEKAEKEKEGKDEKDEKKEKDEKTKPMDEDGKEE